MVAAPAFLLLLSGGRRSETIVATGRSRTRMPRGVITLTGVGTSWSGATIFTVSGVAGVTLVSVFVNSPTSATLVISTGVYAGTLTISDGYSSTTFRIGHDRKLRWFRGLGRP